MSEQKQPIENEEKVIWIPGNLYVEDFVTDGKTSVHGTPVDEYLKSTPGAVLISYEEFRLKTEAIENQAFIKPFEEITEDEWTEKLEVLPPEKWMKCVQDSEAFRMVEYYTGNITGHYIRIGKRYFSTLRRTSQTYQEMTEEIKEQFSF